MNVEQLRVFYKVDSNSKLAKKINAGRTTIWDWEAKGIPLRTQAFFEVLSEGKLKADRKAILA